MEPGRGGGVKTIPGKDMVPIDQGGIRAVGGGGGIQAVGGGGRGFRQSCCNFTVLSFYSVEEGWSLAGGGEVKTIPGKDMEPIEQGGGWIQARGEVEGGGRPYLVRNL